jgi:hypothetical protein
MDAYSAAEASTSVERKGNRHGSDPPAARITAAKRSHAVIVANGAERIPLVTPSQRTASNCQLEGSGRSAH